MITPSCDEILELAKEYTTIPVCREIYADMTTPISLLRRLQSKGAVALERRGVYTARVSEEEYQGQSTRRFIDRLYGGSAKRLVAALVSDGSLSEEDVAELSAMFRVADDE